jgi:hypothetical protein
MILPEFCCVYVPWVDFSRAESMRCPLPAALLLLFLITFGLAGCTADQSPGFVGVDEQGQRKIVPDPQRDQELRENMQRVQMAAEQYASNHGSDRYPTVLDDEFKSYFPGGVEGKRPAPVGPVNVYTGSNEFPSIGRVVSVNASRMGGRFPVSPGKIIYAPIEDGKGYAIMGGAGDGSVMMDDKHPDQVLVLSNIE